MSCKEKAIIICGGILGIIHGKIPEIKKLMAKRNHLLFHGCMKFIKNKFKCYII